MSHVTLNAEERGMIRDQAISWIRTAVTATAGDWSLCRSETDRFWRKCEADMRDDGHIPEEFVQLFMAALREEALREMSRIRAAMLAGGCA